jgi:dinuclear metal center YbgI/SA1388 family protein
VVFQSLGWDTLLERKRVDQVTTMSWTVGQIADFLQHLAPTSRAAEWDNVGLIIGDRNHVVERILTCLTVTQPVVDEAVSRRIDLIVTHHPVLFRPIQKLTADSPQGGWLLTLVRAGIAVYSPHTSWDNCSGGINDLLAELLDLVEVRPLRAFPKARQLKLVVFVPEKDRAAVMDAVFAAGAGIIGNYRECSFRVSGQGTFFGTESAQPVVGEKGRREEVDEWRLEVICPENQIDRVIKAMRTAHSYEEPAYDVYPLWSENERIGEGRWGRLVQPMSLTDLAETVKKRLRCEGVQIVGDGGRLVHHLGLACGAGADFWRDALRHGCDAFLTGEARFHDCLAALAEGMALILPGHFASEWVGVQHLAERLAQQFPHVAVLCSEADRDPLRRL